MSIRDEYNDVVQKRQKIARAKAKLMLDENVISYIKIDEKDKKLSEEEKELFEDMKKEEYNDCDHLLISSKIKYKKKYPFEYCGCIKCGLTDEVVDKDQESLSDEEKIMYEHFRKRHITYLPGKQLFISCDLSLALAICNRIRENYPDIADEKLINYFSIALENMRCNDTSLERKNSRIRRLSLKPDFNSWYKEDIEEDK